MLAERLYSKMALNIPADYLAIKGYGLKNPGGILDWATVSRKLSMSFALAKYIIAEMHNELNPDIIYDSNTLYAV